MKIQSLFLLSLLLTSNAISAPLPGNNKFKNVVANPSLSVCVTPPNPYKPPNVNNPSDYPCAEVPAPGMPDATWTDRLFDANGNEKTGTYTKSGGYCGPGASPTLQCPILVMAYFEIHCDSDQTKNIIVGGKTHCPMLSTFAVNHVTRLALPVPYTPPLKDLLVSSGSEVKPVVIPADAFINARQENVDCDPSIPHNVMIGRDKYGFPICDQGSAFIQEQTDKNNLQTQADTLQTEVTALQKCQTESAQVDAGQRKCTENCTPNRCKNTLFSGTHTTDACLANGKLVNLDGTLFTGDPNSDPSIDQKTFCKMTSSSCSNTPGWKPMMSGTSWWTTTDAGENYPVHTTVDIQGQQLKQDVDNCAVEFDDLTKFNSCSGNTCGGQHSTSADGSTPAFHSWQPTFSIEQHTYYNRYKVGWDCGGSCQNSGSPDFSYYGGDNRQRKHNCVAQITEVGCY